jgi:hypothetical protein
MSKKLSLGGNEKTVPAYYEGQNAQGVPNHFETASEANRLRTTGKARTINRGRAILIRGPRRIGIPFRESVKSAFKVVGQTSKRKPSRPGFPHWSSV